jgi:superoxide oxidase
MPPDLNAGPPTEKPQAEPGAPWIVHARVPRFAFFSGGAEAVGAALSKNLQHGGCTERIHRSNHTDGRGQTAIPSRDGDGGVNVIKHEQGVVVDAISRHSGVMRAIHWITLLLIVCIYALAWSIGRAASRDEAAWLLMMHRSFGLTVAALTLLRVHRRQVTRVPALPDDVPELQRLAANVVAIALYLLASQLHDDHVEVFGVFALPSILAANREWYRWIFVLHRVMALVLLALISVHACAALHHHFVRRDDVLRGMLPALRRQARQGRP